MTEAIPANEYTTVTADMLSDTNAYRYYRYTNPTDMTNIAEFQIDGALSSAKFTQVIDKFSASDSGLSYSYTLPDKLKGHDAYFASYDKDGRLTYISKNNPSGEADGDFTDNTARLLVWEKDTNKPVDMFNYIENAQVEDISAFTDNFESSTNIFGGVPGGLEDGKIVYESGLERFGNVFIPANETASSELESAIELKSNQLFRLKFDMFAGWEQNGKDNTFAIKDAEGNELVALYLTGGGYNLTELRIGGQNVLASPTVSQSRSNPGHNKAGANGWDNASQPYRNNMGYNKSVEIIIKGTGAVSVSFTGGMEDTEASGTLTAPISIKSIEATGACNTSRGRIATYDNFDGDLITYTTDFAAPTPMPTPSPTPVPTPTPIPTNPPVMPEDGTLISLNFDSGDLTSGSSYGKASGTPQFVEVDGRKAAQFTNSAATVITLTDANGNGLLAGQEEITVSFSFKPTNSAVASWWFFAAPNADEQTYQQEHYLGALSNTALSIERYNGGGSRAEANNGSIKINEWNDVKISFAEGKTDLYINGEKTSSVESKFKLSDILGANPVAYIGKANWGSGEFATGYIDDFKIVKGAVQTVLDKIDLGDLSAVTENLTLPTEGGITWTSSNPDVISNTGVVTRPEKSTTVTLTASAEENGKMITRVFSVVVAGTKSSAYLFAHFVGNESNADLEQIYFSISQDGTSWTTINGGKPILTSGVGEKGVRDPYILRGEDGKFFVIATDLSIYNRRGDSNRWSTCQKSGSKSIVVWESSDLVNWSEANLVKVAVDNAGCTWAPEAIYDKEKGQYMVFWASKVSDDNYATQRMYRSYTSDFKTFSAPEIYIDGGTVSNIDTTIVEENGVYYRFTKNESKSSVTMMQSTSLDGPWTDVETYTINGTAGNTVTGYEGPTAYKNIDGGWTLLLDYYSKSQGYKPFVTDNLAEGHFTSAADFKFDATYRHGTVMPITQEEYKALAAVK